MKHRMPETLFMLFLLLILPIQVFAVCPDSDMVMPFPKLVSVQVNANIILDSKTGIYSYVYSIKNGSENIGCIWRIEIDIRKPDGGIDLPKEGLINAPRFASLDIPDEDAPKMIPVTFPSLPKTGNIITWGASLTGRGEVSWSSNKYIYETMPGDMLSGLMMTTYGLPSIRDFKIQPEYIAKEEDVLKMGVSEEEFLLHAGDYLNKFYDSISFRGKTIGPTAPPTDFKPVDFLAYIIDLKHQAFSLGWITNQGVENSLDVKLDGAKKKLEQGNTIAAKNILDAFLNEVEAQGCEIYEKCPEGKHLTPEAYPLLKYNVQYLIERL